MDDSAGCTRDYDSKNHEDLKGEVTQFGTLKVLGYWSRTP